MRLPLFPYDIVLFPGIPLPLRFFEPRYKKLCEDIVGTTDRFGVVLARAGSAFEREIPHDVGTIARISDHTRLPEGQWGVQTVGTQRFRIVELGPREPYLTAEVEVLEESPGNDLRAYALRDSVSARLRRLFALITEGGGRSLPVDVTLSSEPGLASYQVAAVMGIDNDTKQRLLEVLHDDDRLAEQVRLLDAAIAVVERRLARG